MKKIIIAILIFNNTFAQNSLLNLQKYTYYKQRFLSCFISVGNLMGESLPLENRHEIHRVNPHVHELGLPDATIKLGWYMAVLATEYKLLKEQGNDTYQTRKELYYALEAFNRLDLNAENYFDFSSVSKPFLLPQPNLSDLNGFFIRDDMPDGFVASTSYNNDIL